MTKRKKRPTHDDVAMDTTDQVVAIGPDASAGSHRIIDSPDAKPVLMIAELAGDVGIRVFGPPSLETADMLDLLARQYRKSVEMALKKPQG